MQWSTGLCGAGSPGSSALLIDTKIVRPGTAGLRLVSTSYPRDVASALNRTGRGVKTDASKLLRQDLTLQASAIKRGVRIRSRASAAQQHVDVGLSDRPTFLSWFQHRGRKKGGVSVRVSKRGGAKLMRDAFVLRFRSGRRAVAEPPGPGKGPAPRLRSGREGNLLLYSVSVARRLRGELASELNERVVRRLTQELRRQTRTALRRRLGALPSRR